MRTHVRWLPGLALAFGISTGCSEDEERGLPPVSDAFIIGITPASDFSASGLVEFALLPQDAAGEAIIAGSQRGLEVTIRIEVPANTTTAREGETLNQPDPSVQLVTALDLDSSGSMSTNDPGALRKDAAKAFIDQLGEQDQVGIFDFGPGRTPEFSVTRLLIDFTADKQAAKAAVDRVLSAGGTPMFQSIIEVLEHFNQAFGPGSANRSLVVLGDGLPGSGATLAQACDKAADVGIPINTIGFGPAADRSPTTNTDAVRVLRDLAVCSSGAYNGVVAAEDLAETFRNFGQATRSGSVEILVRFEPIPAPRTRVSGTVEVGLADQAMRPVVAFDFVVP